MGFAMESQESKDKWQNVLYSIKCIEWIKINEESLFVTIKSCLQIFG